MTDTVPEINDEALDPGAVAAVVNQVCAAYTQWIEGDEARRELRRSHPMADGCEAPLHAMREALAGIDPAYVDAALRQLAKQEGVELSLIEQPTRADMDAAVWCGSGEHPNEQGWATQIWIAPW